MLSLCLSMRRQLNPSPTSSYLFTMEFPSRPTSAVPPAVEAPRILMLAGRARNASPARRPASPSESAVAAPRAIRTRRSAAASASRHVQQVSPVARCIRRPDGGCRPRHPLPRSSAKRTRARAGDCAPLSRRRWRWPATARSGREPSRQSALSAPWVGRPLLRRRLLWLYLGALRNVPASVAAASFILIPLFASWEVRCCSVTSSVAGNGWVPR